jgi:hypothetical protein
VSSFVTDHSPRRTREDTHARAGTSVPVVACRVVRTRVDPSLAAIAGARDARDRSIARRVASRELPRLSHSHSVIFPSSIAPRARRPVVVVVFGSPARGASPRARSDASLPPSSSTDSIPTTTGWVRASPRPSKPRPRKSPTRVRSTHWSPYDRVRVVNAIP